VFPSRTKEFVKGWEKVKNMLLKDSDIFAKVCAAIAINPLVDSSKENPSLNFYLL